LSRGTRRRLIYAALVLAFVLRHDLWLWDDARLVAGLPIGLVYHVLFCVAVAAIMALLVRFAWPRSLEVAERAATADDG
jgi:hypothetical protein